MTGIIFLGKHENKCTMDHLTIDDVLDLHRGILKDSADDCRVFSEPTLHQLVFRVNSTDDPISRAALVIYHSAVYPSFNDGNKRTAAALANRVLAESGIAIDPKEDQLFELMREALLFRIEQDDIEAWLRENVKPLEA